MLRRNLAMGDRWANGSRSHALPQIIAGLSFCAVENFVLHAQDEQAARPQTLLHIFVRCPSVQQLLPRSLAVDDRRRSLSDLFWARKPWHTLPGPLYTSDAAFEADVDVIFHNTWLHVGMVADVPEPGDVYAFDIGRTPVVIVRTDDDEILGFHNVCRHRGARLVSPGRSIVGKLVCPYHQWAYELSGELVDAPHMGLDLQKSLYHLKPIAVRVIAGLIYICLSDDPSDEIEAFAEIIEPRLAAYNLTNARITHETDLVEHGNWKLTMENNRECYHCAANHPELSLSFFSVDFGVDPAGLSEAERAELEAHNARSAAWRSEREACGLPSNAVESDVTSAFNFRTERLMIAGLGESQTLDSKAAVRVPLSAAVAEGTGDTHLWGPNSWAHFMGDHAVVFSVFPIAPDKTLVRTKWLVNQDAVEGIDYDRDHLIAVWMETNRQDANLVARAHDGVASAGYAPGPYSRFTEKPLNDFITWYAERMRAHGVW